MLLKINYPGHNRLLIIILIVAAVLRLTGLTAFSLSNDELSALSRLQFNSLAEVITNGVYVDFHPAGVQIFLYLWTGVFGFSEWIVRFPFAVMGIVSVYLIYRVGDMWFGKSTGLLAAASLAVLEYPLLYSQIARPYSPGLMVSLAAVFFWTISLLFQHEDKRKQSAYFLLFALSVSACMYTHYFSFIFAGILCFSGLFFLKRETLVPYLLTGVAIVVLYTPHLNIFIYQLSKGGIGGPDGWLGPPGNDAFVKYIEYCFNDSQQLKLIFIIIVFGTVLAFRKQFTFHKFHLLAALFFLLPFSIAYFYSIYINPVFQFSVLLFSFPYLLLLIFSFIPRIKTGTTLFILLFVVLFGGSYSTLSEMNYYSSQHFTEFRKIALRTIEIDNKLGVENITRTINVFEPYYINYYLERYNHRNTYEITKILSEDEKKKFFEIIEKSTTPWFLYSFSNMYDPPEFDLVIRSKFPWLVVSDSMLNSGLRLYSRIQTDSSLNLIPIRTLTYGFKTGEWENESAFHDSKVSYEGQYSIQIFKDSEYGPGFVSRLYDLGVLPGSRIEISSAFMTKSAVKSAKLVLSIEKEGKSLYWFGAGIGQYMHNEGEWFRVFMVADLPLSLSGDEELKVYCWNDQKDELWMDDFRMSIYSPRK